MTDKVLTEAYDKLVAIEEAQSPEEEQINLLTLRMRRATEDNDEAAYHRAVDALNALSDKMQSEQPNDDDLDPFGEAPRLDDDGYEIEEATGDDLHDKAIDLLDDILASLAEEEQYSEKGDILRYAIGRLQEVGLGR